MPPKGEGKHHKTRRERFLRLAEARANAVLEAMRKLGQCSNRMNYAYEMSEVDAMLKAIREAFDDMRDGFVEPEKPARSRFTFGGKS